MDTYWRQHGNKNGIKMDYYGEGLPAISNKALTALLRHGNQRKYLEDEEKAELMKQQDFKCGICGDPLSFRNTEFDHIAPLCATIGEQVFSAVHQHCHSRKTAEEERPLDDDPLTSHVSVAVWKSFIDAPAPPALTYCNQEIQDTQHALILDVRRCRKRCLEYCADDLPVLSPLSEVEELHDCTLGDFVFIDAPYTSFIKQYGYSGKGFYHSCLARWLLHVNVITWSQVTHRLNASAHLANDCLRRPLEIIEACWEDQADRKLAVNSLLGLWCKKRAIYNVTTSRCELDAPAGDSLRRAIFYGEDKTVYDWVQEVSIPRSWGRRRSTLFGSWSCAARRA